MRKTILLLTALLITTFAIAQAPAISQQEQSIFTTEVYFDFGKDTIRIDADSILQQLVRFCIDKNRFYVKITAHTDDVGSNQNNMALSQRRGQSVKDYLSNFDVKADSIYVTVFGENQPVAENNTDEGRQQNRRATVEVIKIKKMIPLTGNIVDKETGEGVQADIIVRSKDARDSLKTDEKGHYETMVPLGEVIGVDVWAKGYFLETKMLKVTPTSTQDLTFPLPPVKEGEKVDIKNLFFVGNQAILLERSEPEMPKILKFMRINPEIKIEIAGHINRPNALPVTKDSWDYDLSVRRALLVYNFLLENGIDKERITYKGYGNWEMRYPRATSAVEQEANRRVEIRILEN